MNLGNKILKIRKDNKMSQESFAEKLNVTRQTVSNWECEKNYPDIETLVLISDKFNISLDILLKGESKMIKEFDKKIRKYRKLKIIITILIITLLFIGTKHGIETYNYYKRMNIDTGGAVSHHCTYNGTRIAIGAKYNASNPNKKWNEPYIYDADTAPIDYYVINNKTKEKLNELKENMNFNVKDFNTSYSLLDAMEAYMLNLGATCD